MSSCQFDANSHLQGYQKGGHLRQSTVSFGQSYSLYLGIVWEYYYCCIASKLLLFLVLVFDLTVFIMAIILSFDVKDVVAGLRAKNHSTLLSPPGSSINSIRSNCTMDAYVIGSLPAVNASACMEAVSDGRVGGVPDGL